MSKCACLFSLPILAAGCVATGWHVQRLDGSSRPSFAASVARLQNALPARRRERFELALAAIWIGHTNVAAGGAASGDRIEIDDIRELSDIAGRVLEDVRRGDLATLLEEERATKPSDNAVADVLRQLDGLEYREVIDVAGQPGKRYLTLLNRQWVRAFCAGLHGPQDTPNVYLRSRRCER